MGICLGQGADLHMAQMMPMSPTDSCFRLVLPKVLVPTHPVSPRQRAIKWVLLLLMYTPHSSGWLGSLVAWVLDLQLAGCEFNSRPQRCPVTTLGKLFTLTCLSRSQWFSDGMIDCDVRGHGQLCLSR